MIDQQGILQNRKNGKRSNGEVQIFVRTPLANVECLKLNQDTSVQDVKKLLGDKLGVPFEKQDLYAGKLKICDRLSLEDQGVADQSSIEMRLSRGLLGGSDTPDKDVETNHEIQRNGTFKTAFQEASGFREIGNAFYKQGNIPRALKEYEQAEKTLEGTLPLKSKDATEKTQMMLKIYLNMALCFLKLEESFKALSYSNKALGIEPRNAKALFRCGQAYGQLKQYEFAVTHMEQAKKQCPNDSAITKELAKIMDTVSPGTSKMRDSYREHNGGSPDRLSEEAQVKDDRYAQQLRKAIKGDGKQVIEKGRKYFDPAKVSEAFLSIQQEVSDYGEFDPEQRLQENCWRAGLMFHGNTPADGNCFFAAVSDQLSLLDLPYQSATQLRQSIVEFLKCNPSIEGPDGTIDFYSTKPDWEAYVDTMSKEGEWADSIIVVASAIMLKRDILVVTSSPQSIGEKAYQWIAGAVNFDGQPIMLGHVWECHYRSLQTLELFAKTTSIVTTDKERYFNAGKKNVEDVKKRANQEIKYTNMFPGWKHTKNQSNEGKSGVLNRDVEVRRYLDDDAVCSAKDKGGIKLRTGSTEKPGNIADKPISNASIERTDTQEKKQPHLMVNVEYVKKKKGKSIPGASDAICAIIACLNSDVGGKVTLNNTTKKGMSCEDFDVELDNYFGIDKLNQTDHYVIAGSYTDKVRTVHVEPVDQEVLLYECHAYKRLETKSVEIHHTKNLLDVISGEKEDLPVLPETFKYNENIITRMTEGRTTEFKEVTSKNLLKNFEERYGNRYISSFANTTGGSILYGISDNGEVKGVEGICDKQGFHDSIADKIKSMHWFQYDRGRISPIEGTHWTLQFHDVVDAPDGQNLYVIVMTVKRLERGVVFAQMPRCPMIDSKAKEGYRMMTFEEWCKYLQTLYSDSQGDFVESVADQLKTHYLNTLCKKQLYPWKPGRYVDLSDIYVHLTMDIEIPTPCKPIKQRLDSYLEILNSEEGDKRFVVEGRPGLGKTTLCAKIAFDWSDPNAKDSPLKDIKLLFILQLGLIAHNTNIEDAIISQLLPSLEPGDAKRIRRIVRIFQKSVVIVFDSLDEADPNLFNYRDSGNIVKAITYEDMKSCRVLVTTRPWRINEITALCGYRRLELHGFIKKDILAYVEQFFNTNVEDVEGILLGNHLVKYIEENKLVIDMSIPLIALLICWYWQTTKGEREIPSRVTQLYDGIFDIMYNFLPSEKAQEIQKETILMDVGYVALQGLSLTRTQLVFSQEDINLSCRREIVDAARKMGLIFKKGQQPNSLTFFHKSAQEAVAGKYLANHPKELISYLTTMKTAKDALSIDAVLIASAAANEDAAECVLKRLLEIFDLEIQPRISQYYAEELPLDTIRTFQQFTELCLKCNYEADAKGKYHYMLQKLFLGGKIYLIGINTYPAVALGYYMTHSKAATHSLTLRPPAHLSDPLVAYGPTRELYNSTFLNMRALPLNLLSKISRVFLAKYRDTLHKDIPRLSPIQVAATIQCIQSCEGLPSATETNLLPIIDGFRHIKLEELDLNNFKLGRNFDYLVQSIEQGHMQSLSQLHVESIEATGQQITRLASSINKTPLLRELNIARNNFEPGKSFPILAKNLASCKTLQVLNVGIMSAPAKDMEVLTHQMSTFGARLQVLLMLSNYVNDAVARNLVSNLPKTLTTFSISMCTLGREMHNKLLLSLSRHKFVEELHVYDSPYPSDMIECAAQVLPYWPWMTWLALQSHEDVSPQVTHKAWVQLKEELQDVELEQLILRNIVLDRDDFVELIQLERRGNYTKLGYSRRCLPVGINVSDLDFLVLV